MGSHWEVWAWIPNPTPAEPGPGYGEDYYWVPVPCRQSLLGVILAARRAKRTAGCVRVEFRG